VWKNGVGKKMWAELLKYESISKDKGYEISKYYEFSQTKWAGGWRPQKDLITRKEDKKEDKRGDSTKHQEKSFLSTPLHKLTARLNSIKSKNTWKAVINQILREPSQLPSAPNQLISKFNDEQKKRYLNKECFFCGETGHSSNSCPKKGTLRKIAVEDHGDDTRYARATATISFIISSSLAPSTGETKPMMKRFALSTFHKLSRNLSSTLSPKSIRLRRTFRCLTSFSSAILPKNDAPDGN